jgi:hypothetical protein
MSFDATRVFSANLIVEPTMQENFGFAAVHFRSPSATSRALRSTAPYSKRKTAGPQAGRASTWAREAARCRRCPANAQGDYSINASAGAPVPDHIDPLHSSKYPAIDPNFDE